MLLALCCLYVIGVMLPWHDGQSSRYTGLRNNVSFLNVRNGTQYITGLLSVAYDVRWHVIDTIAWRMFVSEDKRIFQIDNFGALTCSVYSLAVDLSYYSNNSMRCASDVVSCRLI